MQHHLIKLRITRMPVPLPVRRAVVQLDRSLVQHTVNLHRTVQEIRPRRVVPVAKLDYPHLPTVHRQKIPPHLPGKPQRLQLDLRRQRHRNLLTHTTRCHPHTLQQLFITSHTTTPIPSRTPSSNPGIGKKFPVLRIATQQYLSNPKGNNI